MGTIATGPFGTVDECNDTTELPFAPNGESDVLLNRLQAAIAREETLFALELMQKLRSRLLANSVSPEPGQALDHIDDAQRVYERLHQLYAALARAGASVVESLAEWYRPGESRLQLARQITLEWFDEAARCERMRSLTNAKPSSGDDSEQRLCA